MPLCRKCFDSSYRKLNLIFLNLLHKKGPSAEPFLFQRKEKSCPFRRKLGFFRFFNWALQRFLPLPPFSYFKPFSFLNVQLRNYKGWRKKNQIMNSEKFFSKTPFNCNAFSYFLKKYSKKSIFFKKKT